jgi:hypothetical protein
MFIGHFSTSLAAKALAPKLPLWQLLLAAQAVDILWALFIWLGIERASMDMSLPSNPLTLGHMPYTHSLLGTIAWAVLFGALAARFAAPTDKRTAFVAIAAVVASHWVLDLVVHRPDMAIIPGMPGLGLGLWNHPAAAFWTEGALILAASAFLLQRTPPAQRKPRAMFCGLLLVLHAATLVIPPPPMLTALTLSMLATFALIVGTSLWTERRAAVRI